jgi:glycosyltransferase involved in cell wall biosynthesis
MLISIIIPAHNEEKTIATVLERLLSLNFEKEIIVVNDGSNDNTLENIDHLIHKYKTLNIKVIHNSKRSGKGLAIIKALPYIKGDYVLIQDADLEYDPKEILKLLDHIPKNLAVFGKRNLKKGYFHYRLGSLFLNKIFSILFKQNLKDFYTCYKLIDSKIFKSLNLSKNGFEIEAEITIKLVKKNIKIVEIPIEYNPRTFREGKKIRATDGLKCLKIMLEELF